MGHLIVSPGRVTTVTINRPEVRNALNDAVIAEFTDWATDVATDRSVRVVVLQGAGPIFCAGADLTWMARVAAYTHEENLEDARRAARLFHLLDTLPVPLIGRVQGAALGGGSGLAAVCDVVVAEHDAVFGFTETTLGIVPAMISPYVVRKIGISAARALCLSGVRFPASHALAIGLVQQVVPVSKARRRRYAAGRTVRPGRTISGRRNQTPAVRGIWPAARRPACADGRDHRRPTRLGRRTGGHPGVSRKADTFVG